MTQSESMRRQAIVDRRFQAQAGLWSDVYVAADAFSRIIQYRAALVRSWVAALGLAPGARVLDVGCGTAVVAADLARAGLQVVGLDSASAMIRTANLRTRDASLGHRLSVLQGNALELPFGDAEFDVVVALGLIMWLDSPQSAVREMARVTRANGHVLVHAINAARLDYALDRWLRPSHGLLSARELEALLLATRIQPQRCATFGFGPFTLGGRSLLPGRLGGVAQQGLQLASDRAVPALSRIAGHHLVLGRVQK